MCVCVCVCCPDLFGFCRWEWLHRGIGFVVNPRAKACAMVVAAAANDTWEWRGVAVPVIGDTWDADFVGYISAHAFAEEF